MHLGHVPHARNGCIASQLALQCVVEFPRFVRERPWSGIVEIRLAYPPAC